MKATGMVRCVDHLGRVVLPKEIRRNLKFCDGDPLEFYVDGDKLILRKYDAIGDLEQLLENTERELKMCETMVSRDQLNALLGKVQEMRVILSRGAKKC